MIGASKNSKIENAKYMKILKDCPCGEPRSTTVPIEIIPQSPKRLRNCVCFGPSCIPIIFILALLLIVLLLPLGTQERHKSSIYKSLQSASSEPDRCNIQIVESIPIGLNYSEKSPKFLSTYEAWKILLKTAENTINIASLYWTLRGEDVIHHPSAAPGEDIFNQILSNADRKRLNISIAQSVSTSKEPNLDTKILSKYGAATVRSVDFPKLVGGGVLHTKLWVVDNKHFYIGSANMDWRSLTQVKELGVLAQNCSLLARDLNKIFMAYWYLGKAESTIPKQWPDEFTTNYNKDKPAIINYNDTIPMWTYFSNSPPPLSATGRTDDLAAIIDTISSAKKFVHIAVMEYFPLLLYTKEIKYWPFIDDAIRKAAIENKVAIKMLISWWPHSRPAEDYFLRSLQSITSSLKNVDIQIRRFIVPTSGDQHEIPFSRVNHNKYMVTDKTAYIGTSNWSGDYFTNTAGVGLVIRDKDNQKNENETIRTVRTDLLAVFNRDWESPYAVKLHTETE